MYYAICCCKGTGSQSTTLGSAAASKIASRKSLRPCGYVPRGKESKDLGVALPQDAKNWSCGPFIPFGKAWEEQRAWHRPGNRPPAWRHCFRAFPPPLRWAPSRSHAPFLSLSRTEERQKPLVFRPCGECHRMKLLSRDRHDGLIPGCHACPCSLSNSRVRRRALTDESRY